MSKTRRSRAVYIISLVTVITLFWVIDHYLISEGKGNASGVGMTLPAYVYPEVQKSDIIKHQYYVLSYSEIHEQAAWVAYGLTRSQLTSDDRKRPFFEDDPKVLTFSADWRNYKNSGYDRGHLCPAGDRRFSELAYNETFYTSNVSPMKPDFNAGVWNRLEMQVRQWARKFDTLYVVTGGVLKKGLPSIGYEAVSVPDAFYKIILRGDRQHPEAIAFLIPHYETSRPLEDFRVSIDDLEEETGINFFESLDDTVEEQLEKESAGLGWPF